MNAFVWALFVIVMLIRIIVRVALSPQQVKPAEQRQDPCPPHQWESKEQLGMEGQVFFSCKKCKKISGSLDLV